MADYLGVEELLANEYDSDPSSNESIYDEDEAAVMKQIAQVQQLSLSDEPVGDETVATASKKKNQHVTVNDMNEGEDPFYDPGMDEKDAEYIAKYLQSKTGSNNIVLSCPFCFMSICHDCQAHERYKNQFRAMLVFNCVVNKEQQLKLQGDDRNELFHPVNCANCGTEVGVVDEEEIYEFFNVLSSQT